MMAWSSLKGRDVGGSDISAAPEPIILAHSIFVVCASGIVAGSSSTIRPLTPKPHVGDIAWL